MDRRTREDLVERRVPIPREPSRARRERHVLVQRGVLVARGRFDGRDDLPGDAQLGEVPEARLAIAAEVPNRLVEADEAFLDQVVAVAPGTEIRRSLQTDE